MPLPLPRTSSGAPPPGCFWAPPADAPVRSETRSAILASLRKLARHFAVASLALPPTRELDALRVLTSAAIAAVADAAFRLPTANAPPSAAAEHYAGRAGGPTAPFGFDGLRQLRAESSAMLLSEAALLRCRARLLDYFAAMNEWLTPATSLLSLGPEPGSGAASSMALGEGPRPSAARPGAPLR